MTTLIRKPLMLYFLFSATLSNSGFAINCSLPNLKVGEKHVCTHPKLKTLDQQLNVAFQKARQNRTIDQKALLYDQKAWLRLWQQGDLYCLNGNFQDPHCAEQAIKERIEEIQQKKTFYKKTTTPKKNYKWVEESQKYPNQFHASYPQMNNKKINSLIKKEIGGCDVLVNRKVDYQISMDVKYFKNQLLILELNEERDCGGPHPTYLFTTLIIDLLTQKKISLRSEDLDPKKSRELTPLIFDPKTCKPNHQKIVTEDTEMDPCQESLCEKIKSQKGNYDFIFHLGLPNTLVQPDVHFAHVEHGCYREVSVEIDTKKLVTYFKAGSSTKKLLQRLLRNSQVNN